MVLTPEQRRERRTGKRAADEAQRVALKNAPRDVNDGAPHVPAKRATHERGPTTPLVVLSRGPEAGPEKDAEG